MPYYPEGKISNGDAKINEEIKMRLDGGRGAFPSKGLVQ